MADPGVARPPQGEFAITLKGWRSQLRWAMTQREEDPARVWLEVISIDERSKRALAHAADDAQRGELEKFRAKLEASIASLVDQLGDENVAPLHSWLDLVRQRRAAIARVEQARSAVRQIRAARGADAPTLPETEEEAVEQHARAQGDLDQWKRATPPEPPPEVRASWTEQGGEALEPSMDRDPIAVAKRGDRARALLARAAGRAPGAHPWVRSRGELIAVPIAGAVALLSTLFAFATDASWPGTIALAGFVALGGLVGYGVLARKMQTVERDAAIAWTWHRALYDEKTKLAELEAGWLRALVDSQKWLRTFDAKAGAGGQLHDFEAWRPDLADMVLEVARDTEEPPK